MPRIQSICLPFISWQSHHFWLRYGKFHIWPWKFKVKVIGQGQISWSRLRHRVQTASVFAFRFVAIGSFLPEASFWPSGIVVACVCVCVCVCPSVCQSLACPRDNSGPVQARIAKFGPKMQKTLVKVPIFFFFFFFFWGGGGGGQLTLTFKVKFNFKVRIYPILSLSGPLLTTYSS